MNIFMKIVETFSSSIIKFEENHDKVMDIYDIDNEYVYIPKNLKISEAFSGQFYPQHILIPCNCNDWPIEVNSMLLTFFSIIQHPLRKRNQYLSIHQPF